MTFVRTTALAVLAAACGLALAGPAAAETYSRKTHMGQTVWIDEYTGWNADCSFLDIKIDTVTPPAHGKIRPKIATGRIPKAKIGSSGKCLGKPTQMMQIYYTPARGYRGTDSFAIDMRTPTSSPKRFYYEVTVE